MRKIFVPLFLIFLTSAFFASQHFIMKPETSSAGHWQAESIDLPEMQNPRIVIKKSARTLQVFDGEKLIRTYRIGLGFAPDGDKKKEGDGKTPEGEFYIFTKNDRSKFYLSLGISYPSIDDAERGFRENIISEGERDRIIEAVKNKKMPLQNTKLGGEIYIHGNGSKEDWTWGCAALEDAEMKELFDAIPLGTSVRIEP